MACSPNMMYDLDDTLESDISIDSENWKRQNQMMTANTLGLENILKILLGKVSELESKVEVLEDFKQVGIF
jgi:hypothetical protein